MFVMIVIFILATLLFVGINKMFKIYYFGFKGMFTLYGFCFVATFITTMKILSKFTR